MNNTAEAVVIGGGAIGASTAFHLSKLGLKHVVLCERRTLAGAATGKSAAHIQIGESPEAEARITIASLPYYLHWDEMVGVGSCGFQQTGYMRLHPVSNLTQSQGNAERARALGIDARILDAAQVRDVAPYLAIADDEHAHFQPLAGHASSTGTTFGFAEGAQRLGAEVAEHVAVEEILTHGAQVTGVRTSVGTISTPVVVVAAGAWTALMLASHGLDLPVRIVRTQVAVFSWPAGATAFQIMSVSDAVDGYSYFSSEGVGDGHVIVGLGRRGHSPLEHLDSYDEEGDPSYATPAGLRT